MKFTSIAVAISSLFTSGMLNAAEVYNKDGNRLDLYGKVTALHYFTHNHSAEGDKTYARLGFKGETQIAEELMGYGQWEYHFSGNQAESNGAKGNKTRRAFVGLKFADFGSLDYGRNYGVAYDIGSWTDMLPEFGGDTWTQTDVFTTARTTGVVTWRNSSLFGLVEGLNVAVQYQGKAESADRSLHKQHGDGWGIASTYEYQGFGVGATYAASDRTDAQVVRTLNDAEGDKAEVWVAGLKYDANELYLAATYSETHNMTAYGKNDFIANKTQNVEVVAQYQFDFGLRPSVAYLKSRGKDLSPAWGSQDLVEYVSAGATYYFNKNMATYVDYKINLLNDNTFTRAARINTDDIVAVGMTYQF